MRNHGKGVTDKQLRQQLDKLQTIADRGNEGEMQRLLHDLQTHQIELEMQNRELRETQHELEESRDRYADLYDFAPVGYFTLDHQGRIHDLNLTASQILGAKRAELKGMPLTLMIVQDQKRRFLKHLRQVISSPEEKVITEFTIKSLQGTLIEARFESIALPDVKLSTSSVRTALIDITLQKQAEGKLRQAAKVFDSTQDGIIITDPNGNIVAVNPAFTQITGYREEEAENQNLTFFNSDRQDGATHHHEWWDSPERVNQWQGETRNRKKSGELFAAWENISAVRDSEGGLTNYVVVFSDISNIKDSRERLNYLAYHDPLTDLPNRLLFNARLEHALQQAKRHGRKFAVLFLDLDRFKVINDTLGHKYGDALLKVIAGRLPQCVRAEDTVARLGGDEFVIVLGEVTRAEDAALLAEKVIASITQPITVYDREVIITASIGIGVYPNDADNSLDLIRAADTAMYHAKASGKKTYRFYTAELTTLAFKHLAIEHGLRQALLNNEFVLYYQPMVSLANGNTVCIEALLRWRHPEKGLLEPEDFIGIAEETGIICDIGDWVISEACRQAKSYLVAGLPHVRIAINVSMKQFLNDHLAEKIELACKAAELTRDELDLEIEITESVLQSAEQSIDTLNALHDLGVKLSIDDFGTGYSSLSRLKNFPIDTIKIDRSFVHDLPGDSEGEAIVVAIVALAHTLKLNVVAEGVESLGQHDFLQSHGCNLAQGFLFSKPLTSVEMREFIQRSN